MQTPAQQRYYQASSYLFHKRIWNNDFFSFPMIIFTLEYFEIIKSISQTIQKHGTVSENSISVSC